MPLNQVSIDQADRRARIAAGKRPRPAPSSGNNQLRVDGIAVGFPH